MKKRLPELLAPAGTPEAAWAALAYGADAVYAGLPRFSARAEAGNFSKDALDEMIGYAHHLGRRVFITFNTLVQQRDLDDALEALALIRDLHADGVIVQDLGIAHLIRKNFPQLNLHASTQLAVHNLEGALQLASIGFKRVVLARELSVKTIEHITRECGLETEVFIHGALCYSYSGLCLFSSHLLGRSGNRGRCAYCCRQPFNSGEQRNLPFSMKDFCAAGHLEQLISASVSALKIEGRMKSPLYVAAVTDFYRQSLEGKIENAAEQIADIQTIFGRPSTDLYLDDDETRPVDPINDGHRGTQIGTVGAIKGPWLMLHSNRALQKRDGLKIEMAGKTSAYGFAANEMRLETDPENKRRYDLPANAEIALKVPSDSPYLEIGAPVYCSHSQAVRQRYDITAPRPGLYRQRRAVNVHIVQSAEQLVMTASARGAQFTLALPGPFEAAKQPDKVAAAMEKSFSKLGDTDWQLDQLTVEGPAIFAPASILNEARRTLIEEFSKVWNQTEQEVPTLGTLTAQPVSDAVHWSVKARRFFPVSNIDEYVLEIDPDHPEEIEKALAAYPEQLRLALPVIIRDEDTDRFRELIARFSKVWKWEAANIGGLNLLDGEKDITGDWPLYTLNTQAALHWQEQGVSRFVLSPEDDAENIFALAQQLGPSAIVPVFQHSPLMISATRPETESGELTDRSQRTFRTETNGREFVLVNTTPFCLTDQLDDLKAFGARRFRIDLCYGIDSAEQAAGLVSGILSGKPIQGDPLNFSRGLL
jgi:putative protease